MPWKIQQIELVTSERFRSTHRVRLVPYLLFDVPTPSLRSP